MKKTMFLAALMGAALCGTAMGATTYSWDSATNTTTGTPDGASPVVYSGSVYTWTGANATASGAGSWNYVSDAQGGTTATIAWSINSNLDNPGNAYHALANNGGAGSATSGNFNTIRYAGSTDNKGSKFDFGPLVLAGVIVEEGSTGYSLIGSAAHATSRVTYLGNSNSTKAVSTINEDFTLASTNSTTATGNTGSALSVRGTQDWNIATGKTFTLNSGSGAKNISGNLSILGGGTASFIGNGTTTIAAGTTIDVASGSTLALSGTVNVIVSEADIVSGTETQKTEGNGFGTAQYNPPFTRARAR